MAKKTPTLREHHIIFWDEYTGERIVELDITDPRDRQTFQEIVGTYKSFRFITEDGFSCSVVKEKRLNFYRKKDHTVKEYTTTVWYAHKRLDGKLKRKYIGKAANLTYKKLKTVALELSQRSLV